MQASKLINRLGTVFHRAGLFYYWDSKHGSTVSGAKMVLGAAIGPTMDDTIEGTIWL